MSRNLEKTMPMHPDHSTPDLVGALFTTTNEKVGGVVAGAAITSPLWLQQIKPYSDVAAIFVPILGCIYLLMQIGFKLWDRTKKED
jgi:hypothetical protein